MLAWVIPNYIPRSSFGIRLSEMEIVCNGYLLDLAGRVPTYTKKRQKGIKNTGDGFTATVTADIISCLVCLQPKEIGIADHWMLRNDYLSEKQTFHNDGLRI